VKVEQRKERVKKLKKNLGWVCIVNMMSSKMRGKQKWEKVGV